MAAARQSIITSPPVRFRFANSFSGVIGCAVRVSMITNAATSTTPPAKEPSVTGSVQPSDAARMKPYTRPTRPSVEVSAPGRSNLPGWRSDSAM